MKSEYQVFFSVYVITKIELELQGVLQVFFQQC